MKKGLKNATQLKEIDGKFLKMYKVETNKKKKTKRKKQARYPIPAINLKFCQVNITSLESLYCISELSGVLIFYF